ncbi:RNA polymerase sigma factor [Larkinella sp. VNQ87]|uniref:RNA polymerase sigma factor n=1 Tax=Larkinella sp. VNQ87 TaxID=3400921 RepID=UPI003C09D9AE
MNDVMKQFWEVTYRQSIAKMIGVCYRYTYDRQVAEDLAHDAFLVAIDKSASFENKGAFEAWLRRIVVNRALQYFREQKRQKDHQDRIAYEMPSVEFPGELDGPQERPFSEAELVEAINLLPEHHRLVFNLYVVDGFTHAQIGAELGISEGTSKSHLARARKKIREILQNNVHEKSRWKRFLLLFLLPDRFGRIDQLFRKRLHDFEIQPRQSLVMDTVGFKHIPFAKPVFAVPEFFLKTDLAGLALVLNLALVPVVQLTANQSRRAPVAAERPAVLLERELPHHQNPAKKRTNTAPVPATFSTNRIIVSKQTTHSDTMKKVNTVGALLLTGSALAFDSTSLLAKPHVLTPFNSQINQVVAGNRIREMMRPIESNQTIPKWDSKKIVGTFYASELFWSAENNELYMKGNDVKVNLNTQNFKGSGTFSFLNKVSYVVVDGAPVALNQTVRLTNKKYSLVKLPQAEAINKYGEKANLGVVEITLAE